VRVLRPLLTPPLISALKFVYRDLVRPLIFRMSAQHAHERMLDLLRMADYPLPSVLLRSFHKLAFEPIPTTVGGVTLDSPLILAAGLVKGDGFQSEAEALTIVALGRSVIPGYRSIPALAGAVEFGSFTRWSRVGNPGVVMWRDAPTRSTQNRVGLKNPGAAAAAVFLHRNRDKLPRIFGINIAVSPGVDDPDQEQQEVSEAVAQFQICGIHPAWYTLNVSCPNTEDDPGDHQTEARTRSLCRRLVVQLEGIPLWVKISPTLADSQYRTLLRVFAEEGVRAVIATNTDPQPTPDDPSLKAGVAGGRLHERAVEVVHLLAQEKRNQGYSIDIIGCGGVQNAPTFFEMRQAGAQAVQYWSALIYEGPLAAAFIQQEIHRQEQDIS
jgi:dihydroorotate dehydrogenase